MDVVFLIARILICYLFLNSAYGHLTKTRAMAGYTEARGVPAPRVAVVGSGILMLAGAVMVLLGLWGDLGSLFLALFLVPTALLMHAFWKERDPQGKQSESIQFNKDIALVGAALALFVVFHNGLGLTVTGPLFS
jgi:putative oxidoreductase